MLPLTIPAFAALFPANMTPPKPVPAVLSTMIGPLQLAEAVAVPTPMEALPVPELP